MIRVVDTGKSGASVFPTAAGLLLSLVLLLEVACTQHSPPHNVLLIVVDTLRADHLGAYGYPRDTSPAIDSLAESGTRFARAYSTAPWTMPSVASILTGLYPAQHGATTVQNPLPDTVTTLAEALKAHGFATSGVVSHNLISGGPLNFAQGFDVYAEDEAKGHGYVSTAGVTARALERLRSHASQQESFFLFVHYFDPHFDYQNHAEVDFAAPRQGRLSGGEPYGMLEKLFPRLNPREVQFIRDLYDEEIRVTDAGIARLLSELSALHLDNRTVVVLTADHGEEFGEHGSIGHTKTLYDEVLHVPLIIRVPNGPRRHVVNTPVSMVSAMPTILELAGVQKPGSVVDAASLAGAVRDGVEPPEQTLFSEVDFVPPFGNSLPIHKKSVMRGKWKFIRDDTSRKVEMYDRSNDPQEKRNLAVGNAALAEELLGQLDHHLAIAKQSEHESRVRQIDEEELEGLEALGYIER